MSGVEDVQNKKVQKWKFCIAWSKKAETKHMKLL